MADDDQSAFDAWLKARLREYPTASPEARSQIAEELLKKVEPTVIAIWHIASVEKAGAELTEFVHDVFVEVLEKFPRLKRPATFPALLKQIIQHRLETARQDHPKEPKTVDLAHAAGLPAQIDEAIVFGIEYDSLIQQLSLEKRRFFERETAGLDLIEISVRIMNPGGGSAWLEVQKELRPILKRKLRRLEKIAKAERRKKRP